MFLIRFLAFFDVVAGVLLLLGPESVPLRLLLGHGLYLITKGYVFKGDFLSMMDLVIGFYCILALFLPLGVLSVLAGAFLFGKGGFSFIG